MDTLHQALDLYQRSWLTTPFYADSNLTAQRDCLRRFHALLTLDVNPFARATRPGHITASAFVIDTDMQQVLLTLHAKLNLWLQLGGHADEGQHNVQAVAAREAYEESGLTNLRFFDTRPLFPHLHEVQAAIPFDIDIHQIPAYSTETAHLHYDISYIMVAPSAAAIQVSDESYDLRWFMWEDACTFCAPSVHRALHKLMALRAALPHKNIATPPEENRRGHVPLTS